MANQEAVALFDMDGVLCDYEKNLFRDLKKLQCPKELHHHAAFDENAPEYIKERENLIKSAEEWWINLPKLKLGWDILAIAKKLKFRIVVLTKGSRKSIQSYTGKKRWVEKNLGPDTEMTLTGDKGLVYGRILIDDFPLFIEAWLLHRPRGLVIMPANSRNKDYKHPQVIRYTGKNRKAVEQAMKQVRMRKDGSIS